ncbi:MULTISPECIES: single-stranded DNA-binding protein [unclassified Lentimicrobium]|uniref:single-stranded DNA-binding protein n=1 Tax=unclassified Lentimicrobium TaxID=2677434 RepID=UPI001552598C|nr:MULTISPECIES: single-stranded DNA-binding protein [unclassified Lentimicrobium]NPD46657.1 single-stranded DNA-binding protein [Lentimicrobium sp. S6]NPD85482.1 single-stranded DNA-binding protein [Lentimicrobium sp. L6]
MAGINKVILVGNLGKDPEVMTYENGVKRAAFSLATTESYKDKSDNWVEQTEWHNIVLWRWLAEKNLVKGDKIYLEGKIKTRSWDDENGNKRYTTEIQGEKVLKISSAGGGGYQQQDAASPQASEPALPTQNAATTPSSEEEDDLPF